MLQKRKRKNEKATINGVNKEAAVYCTNSIGDLIICLDIHIPSSSKSATKRYSVEERVRDVLQPLAIRYPKYFDEADGFSEEKLVLSTQEEIEPAEYGRITKDSPRRNIKKDGHGNGRQLANKSCE